MTELTTTESSLKGFLFNDEFIIDNSKDQDKVSKFIASTKYQVIPLKEGHRTFEFVRTIWSFYKDVKNKYKKKCGVGILIGNSEDNFTPYIMINTYNEKLKRWCQRWWKL